ncbi:MAG: transcriptional regulator [Polyangiaceae bacterium]|nr:transcriptional regulator [Polyangiaceae bacterium]
MPLPKSFRTFAEFDRDYLREGTRLGLTVEDLVEEPAFDADLDFEMSSDDDEDY